MSSTNVTENSAAHIASSRLRRIPIWAVSPWLLAAAFGTTTLIGSHVVSIPLRDPGGTLLGLRLLLSFALVAAFVVVECLVRARSLPPFHVSGDAVAPLSRGRRMRAAFRVRWGSQRSAAVVSVLLAYQLIYASYRNLKSWNALRPTYDASLAQFDRIVFAGHDPAVLVHHVFGTTTAASVFAVVYRSFAIVVPVAIAASLAFVPRLLDGYAFVLAMAWTWILGVITYYLIPARGPFAELPRDFAGLRTTAIASTQARYLAERARFIAHPLSHGALNSVGAFASLHTGCTCAMLLYARWLGARRLTRALAVYLVLVMLSTVYFGWHYVSDDIAGIAVGVASVLLGRWMALGSWRSQAGGVR